MDADHTSRSGPLADEEFAELGKTLGTLIQHVMRARQDNPEAGTMAILSALARCGPIRASDVAQYLFLDLSTVSRHVQSLERSGYVEKVADPNDRRAMHLHLTADGKGHVEEFWRKRTDLMRDGLSHWDPDDLRTLSTLMARYTEDFGAIIAKAKGVEIKNFENAEHAENPEDAENAENTGTTEDGSLA